MVSNNLLSSTRTPLPAPNRSNKDLNFIFEDSLPKDRIKISKEFSGMINSVDALSILTEWDEFANFDNLSKFDQFFQIVYFSKNFGKCYNFLCNFRNQV